MQTRTLLAAVATAAVAAIVTPSLSSAQATPPQKTTSKGEVAIQPNFGSLISAINASSAHNDKIKAMADVNATNVQLVNVEDLLKGNDVEALTNALTKNQTDIDALRATLGANATINGVITSTASATTTDAPKLAPADVIAADVSPDGKLVLYYWKKTQ